MDELSEEHRRVLMLREVSGMSYAEIAETLGINEGSVKSRISRARQRLAKILLEKGTFSPVERHNTGREEKRYE